MYYSIQILSKHLLDTCYYLYRIMTEVTTWQSNDDNVLVQTGASSKSLMTLAEITVESIRQYFWIQIFLLSHL